MVEPNPAPALEILAILQRIEDAQKEMNEKMEKMVMRMGEMAQNIECLETTFYTVCISKEISLDNH